MDEMLDISDLNFDDPKSGNLGGDIELLMNTKIKDKNYFKNGGGLDDIDNLDNELNQMAEDLPDYGGNRSSYRASSNLFDNENSNEGESSIRFQDKPFVGQASDQFGDNLEDSKTWDGYGKFNEIPVFPDRSAQQAMPTMTKDELLKEKFHLLRRLEKLEKDGYKLSKQYTIESSYSEMKSEYDSFEEDKRKKNAIAFQAKSLLFCIQGLEWANSIMNPFDIDIDGLSSEIEDHIENKDYEGVFEELYEKYKTKSNLPPELKLIFMLGGTTAMYVGRKKLMKSSGLGDIFSNYPNVAKYAEEAMVRDMMMENQLKQQQQQNSFGIPTMNQNNMVYTQNPMLPGRNGMGPPPPMATQGPGAIPPPTSRQGNNNLADSVAMKSPRFPSAASSNMRPEMRGPKDITSIISGLKTKTLQIQTAKSPSIKKTGLASVPEQNQDSFSEENSIVSDLSFGGGGGDISKSSEQRKKSRRSRSASSNHGGKTISLDL